MTFYAIIFDHTGAGWGTATYVEEPTSYPANEAPCIAAQARNPTLWQLVNGALVQSLSATQTAQIALLRSAYVNAIAADISFTDAAGVTDTYQCDPASIQALQNCLSGFRAAAAVPTAPVVFYWRSATNNNNPFTYGDLEKLAQAITTRNFAYYNQLQALIAKVKAAKKVSAAQAVVWVDS